MTSWVEDDQVGPKSTTRSKGTIKVSTETMPGPVRAFAEDQPLTSIVNAIRDMFTPRPLGGDIWSALAWCVGILIVAYVFAMSTYRREIS